AVDLTPPPIPTSTPNPVATPPLTATPPPATDAPAAPVAPPVVPSAKAGKFGSLLGRLRAPKTKAAATLPAPAEAKTPAPTKDQAATLTGPKLRRKKSKKRTLRFEAPAWVVSFMVHVGLLGALGLASLTPEVQEVVKNLNSAMIDPKLSGQRAEELTPILAEPSDAPRDQAVGETITVASVGGGLGTGSGPPSATPSVSGIRSNVGERTSLPSIHTVSKLSGLAMLPSAAKIDLDLGAGMSKGGGNGSGRSGVAGDVTFETSGYGQALDQLAREILRHLSKHKLTVVWLFDESGSMKDDQQVVKDKFDTITSQLTLNQDNQQKSSGALNHAIVGFGKDMHFEQRKPTADINNIRKAIDRLRVDESGVENVLTAIQKVISEYGRFITKDRRLLIVLVTDESGDDGGYVEEARQLAVARGVPVYVVGRQSLFGYSTAHLLYVDPVTKDHYWPAITRGPETAGHESLQFDGLHTRWDEQPSGFAPYELARLAKDTGGIYFLLPSEENMRVRKREKAYSISVLKEYVPDYESRVAYNERRQKSVLRRSLFEIIQFTDPKGKTADTTFVHRREYPIDLPSLAQAVLAEGPKVQVRLKKLVDIEKKVRSLEKYRAKEPEKRWQAHYDLMLAQVVTYQVKAYEYLACLDEMVAMMKKGKLKPKATPGPDRQVVWVIDHSKDRKAPKEETEKGYKEAERLLKLVIERHPKTPWADLAQDEINRGFGAQRNEWVHNPKYDERAKLVPKY
ncbi:MAG: vWA domain-containing protein, partial [Isosphaeraceae bacterium]